MFNNYFLNLVDVKDTNERYKALNFTAKTDCILNGFGGYFECNLYGKVIMSILPSSFSHGMFSWFPIFFPMRVTYVYSINKIVNFCFFKTFYFIFQEPIFIRKNENIQAHFWRCVSKISVWYEWTISSPQAAPIHNPSGRSYTIGL
jgi:protein arginine N-methyltransferase 5